MTNQSILIPFLVAIILAGVFVGFTGVSTTFVCSADFDEGIGCCFEESCWKYYGAGVEKSGPASEPEQVKTEPEPPIETTVEVSTDDDEIIITPAPEENETPAEVPAEIIAGTEVICADDAAYLEISDPAAHNQVKQTTDSYSFYFNGEGCEGKIYEIGIYFDNELFSTITMPTESIPESGTKTYTVTGTAEPGNHILKVQIENIESLNELELHKDSRRIAVVA